jgi:ferritin
VGLKKLIEVFQAVMDEEQVRDKDVVAEELVEVVEEAKDRN